MSEHQVTPEQEKKWREEFQKWRESPEGMIHIYKHEIWQAARTIDAQRIAELEAQLAATNSRIYVLNAANMQQFLLFELV